MMCPGKNPRDEEILIEYCSGKLDAARATAFERHQAGCPACTRLVAAQNAVLSSLDAWDPAGVSSDFDKRLYARIAQEEIEPVWKRWLSSLWKPALVAAGAGAVLAVILTVRTPAVDPAPKQIRADGVDANQIEKTLDDLDLLTPSSEASQM